MGGDEGLEESMSSKQVPQQTKAEKYIALIKIVQRGSKSGLDGEAIKREYAEQYYGIQKQLNSPEFGEAKKEANEMLKFLCDEKHYIKRESQPMPGSTRFSAIIYKLSIPLDEILGKITELFPT